MRRMIILVIFLFLYANHVYADVDIFTPLENRLKNGVVQKYYYTGDEYGGYFHDENRIPVVMNKKDSVIYYPAPKKYQNKGKEIIDLIPNWKVLDNTKNIGFDDDAIEWWVSDYFNYLNQFRQEMYDAEIKLQAKIRSAKQEAEHVKEGNVRNIVVRLSFKNTQDPRYTGDFADEEFVNNESLDNIYGSLNSKTKASVYSFYREKSYEKLNILSEFYPTPGMTGKTTSFTIGTRTVNIEVKANSFEIDVDQVENDNDFFLPYSSDENPVGYTEDLDLREQTLLWNIIKFINDKGFVSPEIKTYNQNSDNFVDVVTFLFKSKRFEGKSAGVMRPHKSSLVYGAEYSNYIEPEPVMKGGLHFRNYIVVPSQVFSGKPLWRSFCHELGHALLGLPDQYVLSIPASKDYPIGGWSIMAQGFNDLLVSDKKDLEWLDNKSYKEMIYVDLDSNKYEIYPLRNKPTPDKITGMKLFSPYSKNMTDPFNQDYSEHFVLSYDDLKGISEKHIKYGFHVWKVPERGLLLYKINDKAGQLGNYFEEGGKYKYHYEICTVDNKLNLNNIFNATFPKNGYSEVNDFGTTSTVFGTTLDNENAPVNRGGLILRNIDDSDPTKMTFDLFFFDSKIEIEGESIDIFPEKNPVTNKDYLRVVRDMQKGEKVTIKVKFGDDETVIPKTLIEEVKLYFNEKELHTITNPTTEVLNKGYEWDVDIIDDTDNYLYTKTYGKKRFDGKQRVETSRRVYLRHKGAPEVKEKESPGGKDKSELDDVNKRYFDVTCRNYDGSIEYDIEESQFYYRLWEDSEYTKIPSSGSECTWDVSDLESNQYYIKSEFKWSYITETGKKYEKEQKDSLLYNLTRPITLGTITTVFKDPRNYVDPDGGSKYDNIDPLVEVDTLSVSVPLAIDPDKWGDVEILKNGEKDDEHIYKPLTEDWYKVSSDGKSRIYKFVWDYTDEPEGFATLRARYVLDTLSWSQKKTKVAYAETWEDFDNVSGGGIPEGWEVGTQYAYPPGNAPEAHYWRTSNNTNIYDVEGMKDPLFTSNDLRTSTAAFTSQRFEILSPVIEVPEALDSVNTFLVFDYKRALSTISPTYENAGRSLMVIQVCDEGGNMIDQFFGAMDTSESIDGAHFPISGSYLNMPNFFWFNLPGLYGDNDWNEYTFWLNFGSAVGNDAYHDYSGQRIRLKFIQYFNNDFVGIVDNWNPLTGTPLTSPGSTTFNPPEYTELTYHQFDNFIVKTYYDINLPPTIKQVPDQEVIQHCGWQHIELTEITNGQSSILGDYEDLDTQGKSSILNNIVSILGVEETDSGVLKVTALAKQDDEIKEVSFNPNTLKKDSKSLYQQVIEMKISSSNEALLPLDSLRYEFTPGAERVDLYYHPADSLNGEVELRVWLKDSGGTEHNGRDTTSMKFKVNVIPFNAPKYDPPITDLEDITEDFPEFTINLGNHFKDPEGDKIYYSIDADTSLVDITLEGDVLNVKSRQNVYGTGILTIMADDRSGAIPTVITANIDIKDDGNDFEFDDQYLFTNDYEMPVKNLAVNFEPDSVDITEMFSSEATAGFTYSVTLDNDTTLIAGIRDHYIELNSIPDSAGVAVGTIRIGYGGSFFETKLKFVVGNLPPEIITEIADIETPANFKTMYINLKDHYRDPNKDWLGYTVKSSQEKVDTYISFYDDQLIIESKANESGIDSLYISIYDGEFTVRDSLKITIGDVDVPVPHLVTPIPDQRVKEDFGRYEIDLNNHFADPAGTGIAYVVDFDSTKVKCSIEDGHILVVNSVKNFHGYAPIMVAIDDGEKIIREGEFEDCDPKNVVRISEKIRSNGQSKK